MDGKQLKWIVQWTGLILAPLAAATLYLVLPDTYVDATGSEVPFTHAGQATLAIMLWMALWWLTEAVDITVTALLPLAVFPILEIADIKATAAPYANPLIFLFMGGFLLAISMQRWGLGLRIALTTLKIVGTQPTRMIGGFMLVTAVLSAFVSNTATSAMMLPIALSVIALLKTHGNAESGDDSMGKNFALCLLLGIAYAASIGGVATIIGTPPNVFLAGFLDDKIDPQYQTQISFARWMMLGVPLAMVFLPITWLLLTKVLYPIRVKQIPGAKELIQQQVQQLGKPNRGEWATFIVFILAVTFWITRSLLTPLQWTVGETTLRPFASLTDEGIAMTAAMLLFVIPSGSAEQRFVLNWENAKGLPWGILLLFGGGLSLASAVAANGVAEFLGAQATYFAGAPVIVMVLCVSAGILFLTELTSNTATAATLVPVLAALAPGLGVHPYILIFPATLAASCAFMLPVATPPNAIIFGSGEVTIPQMAKAGLWLNLIGVLLITALTMTLVGPLFAPGN